MHKRFIVTRLWVKYGRQIYRQGELLPATFTERDVYRNIYPSRIGEVTLTDEELAKLEPIEEIQEPEVIEAPKPKPEPEPKVEAKTEPKPVKVKEEVKAKPVPKAKKSPVKKAPTTGAKPTK